MILNDEFGFWCIKLCLLIMFSKAIACSELQCHLLLPFSCPPYNDAFPKKSCNALSSCLFASSKHLQFVMRKNAMHMYVTSSCTLHDGNTFVLFFILNNKIVLIILDVKLSYVKSRFHKMQQCSNYENYLNQVTSLTTDCFSK